jgi:FtsP/CotA-like multicopper oxidase with cupredoxin domain
VTAPGSVPDYFETPNWANSPPLRKFVDTLAPLTCTTPNNLGQCLPVAVADTTTYTGSDYYEIAVVEYREVMHSDFALTNPLLDSLGNPTTVKTAAYGDPAAAVSGGTKLRGYVQEVNGVPVTDPHYLGPIIVAQKDRPVRIKFINRLPGGSGGDLFVPVDTSVMGSGEYTINYDPETKAPRAEHTANFTQNRAELHLHGGRTPWISDGTPHQWITPAADTGTGNPAEFYPKGVSVAYVPDMWFDASGNTITTCAGQTTCGDTGATNNPGPGAQTYFLTNAQSARLMFYHDHAWGITRLNVYVGEAAGYAIEDTSETALFGSLTGTPAAGTLSPLITGTIPLVIQDKTFIDPATIQSTDPTWAWGSTPPNQLYTTNPDGTALPSTPTLSGQGMNPVAGDLWWPHVYMPAQNPFNPNLSGINDMGRWHYGPWFFPSTPVCGTSADAVKPLCIEQGVVPNPYFDPACVPANNNFCQPEVIPGTPNVSWGAEAFLDTMMVNGTVYPTHTVTAGTYRLRILNASHDRFLNLQFYQAEPMSIGVTSGGSGYTSPPAVTISGGSGSGATAVATVSGSLSGAAITSGGSGFTSAPTVTIIGDGAGATATAVIGGGISQIYPTNGGSGYTAPPAVTITSSNGPGTGATAVATIEGYVDGITVNNGGTGYEQLNPPVVTVSGGGGIGAEATAVVDATGVVTAINVTPGVNYTTTPTVTIAPPVSGTTATATATLAAFVSGITVTSTGTGYTAAPNVTIAAPTSGVTATARAVFSATGVVTGINVTNGGTGYTSANTLISFNGGGGTGADATAQVSGSVTGITVTDPGTGYTTAPTVTIAAPGGAGTTATALAYLGTEVKMVPAAASAGFPPTWPIDGREGGAPDPAFRGPAFIQFATEGGFLPGPVVLNNQPVQWNLDPTMFNVGNVLNQRDGGGTLFLAPAERADVLVDFSQYAGKTLILYNDAPTAFPALDPHYDYYTGAPDRTDIGGYTAIQPGVGPNVRTVMQIKVGAQVYGGQPAPNDAINSTALSALQSAFAGPGGVFAAGQEPIVVGQSAYDTAYANAQPFPATYPNWGISRISDGAISFMKADGTTPVTNFAMKPKAIHDEMGGTFDEFGRMSAKLGLEAAFTNTTIAGFVVQNYVDPVTEIVRPGEPQIWRITHNGVDTHPIHFHLFDVQVLNRVGWDGFIRLPDDNELGWKDTVRISPLEDTIVALKPVAPPLPFGLPVSIRPLNPQTPVGPGPLSNMGFSNMDPVDLGNALATPTVNAMTNFGFEYVWHCHILSHEENDMMRTTVLQIPHHDFFTDGKTDIIWTNTADAANNTYLVWNMDGVTKLGADVPFTNPGNSGVLSPGVGWTLVATGDFNHDGKPDVVWRNQGNGQNVVWYMNGAAKLGEAALPTLGGNSRIVGTADFNNDGNIDILWRNDNVGTNAIWLMNGIIRSSVVTLPNLGGNSRIVGTGDFNNDGSMDILWRNDAAGTNAIWLMNKTIRASVVTLPSLGGNSRIVGTGDFNNDGNVDILWRNNVVGTNAVWLMNGTTRSSVVALPALVGANWQIVGR